MSLALKAADSFQYNVHPKDPNVGYGDIDFLLALDLVRRGLLKAFIIPHPNKQSIIDHASQLTREEWQTIFNVERIYFKNSRTIIAPKTNIVPKWIEHEVTRIFNKVSSAIPDTPLSSELYINFPGNGSRGFAPYIHSDANTVDIHFTLAGAPLQWTTLTTERDDLWHKRYDENSFVSDNEWEKLVKAHPDFESTIIDADIGDIIIFNHRFGHRSSKHILRQGRISGLIMNVTKPIFK